MDTELDETTTPTANEAWAWTLLCNVDQTWRFQSPEWNKAVSAYGDAIHGAPEVDGWPL